MNFISKTWVLLALFVAMLAIGASFSLVERSVGVSLLDMQIDGKHARAVLGAMTDEQKRAHVWVTLINDTAYPISYGLLFAGIAWRFAGRYRDLAIIPAFGGAALDLMENGVQVAALLGHESLLNLKDVLTPAKFGAVLFAMALSVLLLLMGAKRRLRQGSEERA